MPIDVRYFIRDIKENNPHIEHKLWTDNNLPKMPENVNLVYNKFGDKKQYAFQADVLRIFLIKEYGGIYLDADFNQIGSLDELFDYENFFCEWNKLLLNGTFGAKKGSELIEVACREINLTNDWYGPSWFTKVIDKQKANIMPFIEFEEKYAKHHALGSWLNIKK